jgi:hypothetical protein
MRIICIIIWVIISCLWQTKNVGYGTPFMHAQLGHYIEKATC